MFKSEEVKQCHQCKKILSRPSEILFSHCFECNSKRLEQMTLDFDPCPICNKRRNSKSVTGTVKIVLLMELTVDLGIMTVIFSKT